MVTVSDYAAVNGGAAGVAIEAAVALAGRGVGGAFFGWSLPADPRLAAAGLDVVAPDRPAIPKMPGRERLVRGIWNEAAGVALERLLARYDPCETVVHVHSWFDANTPAVLAAIRRGGFAHLVTAHDYALACPYGGFFDHEQNAICTRKPLGLSCVASRCNAGSRAARMWFLAKAIVQRGPGGMPRRLPHVIFVSEFARAILAPYLPAECVGHVVPNAIAPPTGTRAEAERNAGFLYVGRLSPEKDPATFLAAARRARVRATVCGAGVLEERLRADFPEAEFLGWRTPEEVRARIRAARAVIFPSRWYETAGLAAVEAMAEGTPVFVSDACAAREFVQEYGGGTTFRSQNDGDLARLMASTDGEIESWSRTGFTKYAADPMTMQTHLDRLVEVYEKALGGA